MDQHLNYLLFIYFLCVKYKMSGESRNFSVFIFFIHKENLQSNGKNTRFIVRKKASGIH